MLRHPSTCKNDVILTLPWSEVVPCLLQGKMISVEQFVAMYHRLMIDEKMETYEGDFSDFMLIMELYDIHQNGRALISELEMALLRLGS